MSEYERMVSRRCLGSIRKVSGNCKKGVWKAHVILNLAPPLRVSGVIFFAFFDFQMALSGH